MTRQDQAEAARIVVGLEPPSERVTVDDVRRTGDALREPDGSRPTLALVAERLGRSERWISKLCNPHGGYRQVVPDRK